MLKLVEKNPSEPVEVLSWLSRATLDIIGQAGIPLSAVLARPKNSMRLNHTIGFNYDFDALSVGKKPNELNQAFTTLFHTNRSVTFLNILQAFLPIFRFFVSTNSFGTRYLF